MCAIAGLISRSPDVLTGIVSMTQLQRHRGPDDEGFMVAGADQTLCFSGGETPPEVCAIKSPFHPSARFEKSSLPKNAWLALGHRRLSILDLSPMGHQPMSWSNRYWIVFNGEVFNYLELRAELEDVGCCFLSQTDTEVILAAYATWGADCFSRFNGMWGIAIYDSVEQSLLLARDRFGVKPLYHWSTAGSFAFASEIKAFTGLPGWRPRLNGQAVHDFLLSSMQDHSGETMFADVFQLEPGCHARLDCRQWRRGSARLEVTRWYELRPRPFSGGWSEAPQRFRELLKDSVRLRLRSDVPVGSCLSGGLDSSAIVCVANRLLRDAGAEKGQQTFSSCSQIPQFDESQFVETVVEATGISSAKIFPTGHDLFQVLDKLTWHQDEPFASTSIFAQWSVFQAAANAGVKVMLDGQGADEMLYGYSHFQRAFLASLLSAKDATGAWREARALRGSVTKACGAMLRAVADTSIPNSLQRFFRRTRRNARPSEWFSPSALALASSFPGPLAAPFQHHRTARELSGQMLRGGHLQRLLHWEDRNSMAYSIESRVPFLDYRLVEFVLGLPDRCKIREGVSKAVLREGMKGIVPDAVLRRRDKMGFVTAEAVWAREECAAAFRESLQDAVDVAPQIVRPEALAALDRFQTGHTPYDSAVWRVISFGRWVRRFGINPGA